MCLLCSCFIAVNVAMPVRHVGHHWILGPLLKKYIHTCCVELTMAQSMQLYTPVNVEQYVLSKAVTLMCAAPSLVLRPASSV